MSVVSVCKTTRTVTGNAIIDIRLSKADTNLNPSSESTFGVI
jgi:hypothetical protein